MKYRGQFLITAVFVSSLDIFFAVFLENLVKWDFLKNLVRVHYETLRHTYLHNHKYTNISVPLILLLLFIYFFQYLQALQLRGCVLALGQ